MFKELKDSNKKAIEIYERARCRSGFGDDLDNFRKKYHIPKLSKAGRNQNKIEDLLFSHFISATGGLYSSTTRGKAVKGPGSEYLKDRIVFLRKYGLPTIGFGEAMDAALLNRTPSYMPFSVSPTQEIVFTENTGAQLCLQIDSLASRDETLEYIRKNWSAMQELLLGVVHKRARVKTRGNRDRDDLIFTYYDYYRKHPVEWVGRYKYPSWAVRQKLIEDGYSELDTDNIEQIFKRENKRRAGTDKQPG